MRQDLVLPCMRYARFYLLPAKFAEHTTFWMIWRRGISFERIILSNSDTESTSAWADERNTDKCKKKGVLCSHLKTCLRLAKWKVDRAAFVNVEYHNNRDLFLPHHDWQWHKIEIRKLQIKTTKMFSTQGSDQCQTLVSMVKNWRMNPNFCSVRSDRARTRTDEGSPVRQVWIPISWLWFAALIVTFDSHMVVLCPLEYLWAELQPPNSNNYFNLDHKYPSENFA